eukprot:Hpha_TRINITY_DN15760_c3_g7::TRINITY_DN15760_c3_g7_i1::g.39721::m.39721
MAVYLGGLQGCCPRTTRRRVKLLLGICALLLLLAVVYCGLCTSEYGHCSALSSARILPRKHRVPPTNLQAVQTSIVGLPDALVRGGVGAFEVTFSGPADLGIIGWSRQGEAWASVGAPVGPVEAGEKIGCEYNFSSGSLFVGRNGSWEQILEGERLGAAFPVLEGVRGVFTISTVLSSFTFPRYPVPVLPPLASGGNRGHEGAKVNYEVFEGRVRREGEEISEVEFSSEVDSPAPTPIPLVRNRSIVQKGAGWVRVDTRYGATLEMPPYYTEEGFWKEYSKSGAHLATDFIDPSAQKPPFAERAKQIETLLRAMRALLNRVGVKWWLDWGSLLGAVRNQSVIPWDTDGDISMMGEDVERVRQAARAKDFRWEGVACQDCLLIGRWPRPQQLDPPDGLKPDIPLMLVNVSSGVYIDIFWYFRRDGLISNRMVQTYNPFSIEEKSVFPLSSCNISDVAFSCPNDTHAYLAEQFGIHWDWPMVPAPLRDEFKVDLPPAAKVEEEAWTWNGNENGIEFGASHSLEVELGGGSSELEGLEVGSDSGDESGAGGTDSA